LLWKHFLRRRAPGTDTPSYATVSEMPVPRYHCAQLDRFPWV